MISTVFVVLLVALAAVVLVGAALFPLAMLSGLWAHHSAKDNAAKAAEIEALLAED